MAYPNGIFQAGYGQACCFPTYAISKEKGELVPASHTVGFNGEFPPSKATFTSTFLAALASGGCRYETSGNSVTGVLSEWYLPG